MKIIAIEEIDGQRGPGIRLSLDNGTYKVISDDGQSCCENRYWVVDNDLSSYIGSEYLGWELRSVSEDFREPTDDVHEIQFLWINTSAGTIDVASHNEHNGYYGGFDIREFDE